MNRSEIIKAMERKEVDDPEKTLNKVISIITTALAAGETVKIRNFGVFHPTTRAPITRKNPKTGIPVSVPERKTVTFSASPALKFRVNRNG